MEAGVTIDFFSVESGVLPRPEEMSSLSLAYIGDAVWEIMVRRHLLVTGELRPNRLHKAAVRYVRAGIQAKLARYLEPLLTEPEQQVFRRGRNAKSAHVRKNADVIEYRHSTGFEALFGYLYITGQFERMQELGAGCIRFVEE
ncbi:MAG: ribonuclease, partial [Bacilli bacterium]|nr:ribonuclease [Bacilli bacterium]